MTDEQKLRVFYGQFNPLQSSQVSALLCSSPSCSPHPSSSSSSAARAPNPLAAAAACHSRNVSALNRLLRCPSPLLSFSPSLPTYLPPSLARARSLSRALSLALALALARMLSLSLARSIYLSIYLSRSLSLSLSLALARAHSLSRARALSIHAHTHIHTPLHPRAPPPHTRLTSSICVRASVHLCVGRSRQQGKRMARTPLPKNKILSRWLSLSGSI